MHRHRLEARHLEVFFGRRPVLDDLSLTVDEGERLGLVGRNGSGKSTLLALIAGSLRPRRGEVRLDGAPLRRWTPRARAQAGIGRGFQGDALAPSLTVRAHLELSQAKGRGHRSPGWWAEILQLAEVFEHRVSECTRSQRRRLGLGLALAAAPKVLLLDEPFAGLAPDAREPMLRALEEARRQRVAVLWVEHERDLLDVHADRVLSLVDGQLEPPNEIPSPKGFTQPPHRRTSRGANSQEGRVDIDLSVSLDGGAVRRLGPLRLSPGQVVHLPEAGGVVSASLLGLSPSSGRFEIDGRTVPASPEKRRRLGIVGVLDPPQLIPDLRLKDHLRLGPRAASAVLTRLLPQAPSRIHVPARFASGGEQRMVALSLALAEPARLIVLEEATTGLAPSSAQPLARILRERIEEGASVLFTGPSRIPQLR